jgi:hypothetical protein
MIPPTSLFCPQLPSSPERHVYAVLRPASLRRPAVQVTLAALRDAARRVEEELSPVSSRIQGPR